MELIRKKGDNFEVPNKSDPSKSHNVSKIKNGEWVCSDCKEFDCSRENPKSCSHIKAIIDAFEPADIPSQQETITNIKDPIQFATNKEEEIKIPERYILYTPYRNSTTGEVNIVTSLLIDGYIYVAHKVGFRNMETYITQYPCIENSFTAFAESILIDKNGIIYKEIGDANVGNIKRKNIQIHFTRMAATRALGRVLRRWLFPYTYGIICAEELGDTDVKKSDMVNMITKQQKDEMRKLLEKIKPVFKQNEDLEVKEFILNLTKEHADIVLKRIKNMSIFDYQAFVSLKSEISDIKSLEVVDNG